MALFIFSGLIIFDTLIVVAVMHERVYISSLCVNLQIEKVFLFCVYSLYCDVQ